MYPCWTELALPTYESYSPILSQFTGFSNTSLVLLWPQQELWMGGGMDFISFLSNG
jgi:hypothetical protein